MLKLLPSLTNGTAGNERFSFIVKLPRWSVYKFDITSKRSDVVLTGKNRRRGTLIPINRYRFIIIQNRIIPCAPSKFFIAAPLAVSNWITLIPLSNV